MAYTPFKMKGNPAKGGIQGTAGHESALKLKLFNKRKKVDPDEYKGETESSTANRNIRRGKQEKQRAYVEDINERLGSTKKQKRAQKKIMNKSEKIRKREARQADREKRTGKKEGTGIIGKIRGKVIDVTQKGTTRKINKQMDKLSSKQAFNTARRYIPGETYTYKGESGKSEKVRSKKTDQDRKSGDPDTHPNPKKRKDDGNFIWTTKKDKDLT